MFGGGGCCIDGRGSVLFYPDDIAVFPGSNSLQDMVNMFCNKSYLCLSSLEFIRGGIKDSG